MLECSHNVKLLDMLLLFVVRCFFFVDIVVTLLAFAIRSDRFGLVGFGFSSSRHDNPMIIFFFTNREAIITCDQRNVRIHSSSVWKKKNSSSRAYQFSQSCWFASFSGISFIYAQTQYVQLLCTYIVCVHICDFCSFFISFSASFVWLA